MPGSSPRRRAGRPCPSTTALDLLVANGVPPDDLDHRVIVVEATATGPDDLRRWQDELADGLVQRLANEYADFRERGEE